MTLETLSTAAAVGTFLVIAATAIAAIVQLRQLRASNQLHGLIAILSLPFEPILMESFEFTTHELSEHMKDPEFRRVLEQTGPIDRSVHKELRLCDYYERLGSMVKYGLFWEELYFDNSSPERFWELVAPVIAIQRRARGSVLYENFEYLVARSREWDRRHANGNYPSHTKRLVLEDVWLAEDRRLRGAHDQSAAVESNVGG
jgi:hypothetical protein